MEINQLRIKIKATRQETSEAYTYCIENITGAPIIYRAGQFITLLLYVNGREMRRSYSFSSTPGVDTDAAITIQRVVNGAASRYIIDHIKVGDEFDCLAPAGRFVAGENDKHHVFIAAGSGITPVFSIIKHLLHSSASTITLINQNSNEKTSIFRKELLLLQEGFPKRLQMIEFFSQPFSHPHHPQRLNNFLLEKLIEKKITTSDAVFFLCGPIAFMRMCEFTLKLVGYPASAIRKEIFEIPRPAPPPLAIDVAPKHVTFLHGEAPLHFDVQYPQTILTAARNNNIHLPFSCMGGRCSTCTVTLLSGKVHMTKNEVLTAKDIEQGLVLTCVGYAQTDIVIKLD